MRLLPGPFRLVLEFALYLLYSVNPHFASHGGSWLHRVVAIPILVRTCVFLRQRRKELIVCLLLLLTLVPQFAAAQQAPSLELSRTVRSWEFLPVVGTR